MNRIALPRRPLLLQTMLVMAIPAILSLMPPERGSMLIVSLHGQDRGAIARWAIEQDARLLGAGPWPHSLVVEGNRARLLRAAVHEKALLMTASLAGCGVA